jgi:hypothetical protein
MKYPLFASIVLLFSSCTPQPTQTYLEASGVLGEWTVTERIVGMNMTPGTVSGETMMISAGTANNEEAGNWDHHSQQGNNTGTFILDTLAKTFDFYDSDSVFHFSANYTFPAATKLKLMYEDQGLSVEEIWEK